MNLFNFFLLCLAVENLAEIIIFAEIFAPWRYFLKDTLVFGKLLSCKFCVSFWLMVVAVCFEAPSWMVLILAGHRVAQFLGEFGDRYMNRSPIHVFAQLSDNKQEP